MPASEPASDNPLGPGLPLGRYRGVQLAAHWSVLVTLGLLTFLLATSGLPTGAPGYPAGDYWLAGAAASLAFLASLAAHELAHAVTAKHYGLPVRRITLWLLGGFTELTAEARTARAEALIAAAGPATSLALGVLGGGAAVLAALAGAPMLVIDTLAWLAVTNFLLGLFNLLPGSPLDGGRLLAALLWWRSGDRRRATRTAASAGSVLGVLLIALGLVEVIAGMLGGLWLVLVGGFLRANASAQASSVELTELAELAELRVADVMRPVTVLAPSWWTVTDFVARCSPATAVQRTLPLVDPDGSPTGLISWADLVRVPAAARDRTRLAELDKHPHPVVVPAELPLPELPPRLAGRAEPAVVVAGGRVVGLAGQTELRRVAELRRLGWHPPAAAGTTAPAGTTAAETPPGPALVGGSGGKEADRRW